MSSLTIRFIGGVIGLAMMLPFLLTEDAAMGYLAVCGAWLLGVLHGTIGAIQSEEVSK